MTTWQPIETAPKDGTWIVGFCGGETIYIVMRWWDGVLPDCEDDLSTDEVGEWVVSGDVRGDGVTHWAEFFPHPEAPPKTVSLRNRDGIEGIRHPTRAERGISEKQIMWNASFNDALLSMEDSRLTLTERTDRAIDIADEAVPGAWEEKL